MKVSTYFVTGQMWNKKKKARMTPRSGAGTAGQGGGTLLAGGSCKAGPILHHKAGGGRG